MMIIRTLFLNAHSSHLEAESLNQRKEVKKPNHILFTLEVCDLEEVFNTASIRILILESFLEYSVPLSMCYRYGQN